VEPADDEHVLLPADDDQTAVGVEFSEVAGVQPAVGVDRFGGRLRIVEIALHHVVAADEDFAVAGDTHFDVLAGCADGGRDLFERVAASGGGDGAGLGEAVAGHDGPEGKFVADTADEVHRNVGRTGDCG